MGYDFRVYGGGCMSNVTITISGPGETMSGEIFVIKNSLEEAGFQVSIEDDYPCDDPKIIDKCIALKDKHLICIKVNHKPWGG